MSVMEGYQEAQSEEYVALQAHFGYSDGHSLRITALEEDERNTGREAVTVGGVADRARKQGHIQKHFLGQVQLGKVCPLYSKVSKVTRVLMKCLCVYQQINKITTLST